MKTDEVISTLKLMQAKVEWEYPMEYAAAIDEAIEALHYVEFMSCQQEGQKMENDLISRRRAIQAIRDRADRANTFSAFWEGLIIATGIVNGLPASPISPTQMSGTWIPVMDRDGKLPEVDEDGCSLPLLISTQCTIPAVGQYRVDESGDGAFYDYDGDEPLSKIGIFVTAWMYLPESYKEG